MGGARAWPWAVAFLCLAPACTYVIAPLDDVRVFGGASDAGDAEDLGVDAAPDTAIAPDTTPIDSAPETAVDAGPCTSLLSRLAARQVLRPDSPTLKLADLNGDGKLDMIAPSRPRNAVQVLLGNGDGSFGAYTETAVSQNPVDLAVGDVNGDGKLDVVVTSSPPSSGSVSVLLGNGDGTLGGKTDFTSGVGTIAVALADVNKDSKLDVLAVSLDDAKVNVLLGNGDGTFQAKVDYAVTTGGSIAVADVNGDGNPDVFVINSPDSTVSVLLGKGDGTFHAKVDYPTDATPTEIAVADVNGDGRPDIVTTNASTMDPSVVSVLLAKSDGTFNPKTSVVTGKNPYGLALVDLDGDGKVDIAAACAGDETVTINRGKGDGTFAAAEPYATFSSAAPIALAAGDLDKDGRVDLVAIDDLGAKTITMLNACK